MQEAENGKILIFLLEKKNWNESIIKSVDSYFSSDWLNMVMLTVAALLCI